MLTVLTLLLKQQSYKIKKATEQEIITKTVEFVIEKSKLPKKIGINLLIENCSKGEKNI